MIARSLAWTRFIIFSPPPPPPFFFFFNTANCIKVRTAPCFSQNRGEDKCTLRSCSFAFFTAPKSCTHNFCLNQSTCPDCVAQNTTNSNFYSWHKWEEGKCIIMDFPECTNTIWAWRTLWLCRLMYHKSFHVLGMWSLMQHGHRYLLMLDKKTKTLSLNTLSGWR